MRQFTITQLLMVTWLIAIFMAMATWEGCGTWYQKVSDLAFSPDGKHLVVVHYVARDANVPFKVCLADISRTISILDVTSGRTERVIEQVKRPGDAGAAFQLYEFVQKNVAYGPGGKVLLVQGLGGGMVRNYDLGSGQWQGTLKVFAAEPPLFFAVSPDGNHGAASTMTGLISWDLSAGQAKILDNTAPSGGYWGGPPLIAISPDGGLIAVAATAAVDLRSGVDGAFVTPPQGPTSGAGIRAIAFSPDGRLLAVGGGGLSVYDMKTLRPRPINIREEVWKIAFSPDSKTLAANDGAGADLFDVASGHWIDRLECAGRVTSLEYSPKGALLAIGDSAGRVSVWNPVTGDLVWTVRAPGPPGASWVHFAVALAIWAVVCYAIWKRRRKRSAACPKGAP